MKTKYFLIISIFYFLSVQYTYAQFKLTPAKLVKTAGDTITGFVNYYDWATSPDRVEFKSTVDSPIHTYLASEVSAFYLPSQKEWYVAKPVTLNFYANVASENSSKIGHSVTGVFFLNRILKGESISLFKLVDENESQRFFIQRDTVLSELIHYNYSVFKEGKYYTKEINQYINQLRLVLNDCSSLQISNTLPYSESDISQLIAKYYSCKGGRVNYIKETRKPRFNPVISSGIIKISNYDIYIPAVGIGLKAALPNKFYNRYAMVQLHQLRYNFVESGNRYKGQSYQVNFLIGTYFGKSKVQPFVHAGLQWPSSTIYTVGGGLAYAKKINLEIKTISKSGFFTTISYAFGKTQ